MSVPSSTILPRSNPISGDADERLLKEGFDMISGELAALDQAQAETIRDSWPGPETWILPNQRFPYWITGDHAGVAPAGLEPRRLAGLQDHHLVAVRVEGSCQEGSDLATATGDHDLHAGLDECGTH